MDFKLVSKNNMGIVATLILIILLSQSRFFNFLLDNALGRAILILFILGISYAHKILGVITVLFIIIIFNQSNIGYIEGFTETSANSGTSSLKPNVANDKQKEEQLKLNNSKLQNTNSLTSDVTPSIPSATTTSSAAAATPSTNGAESFKGREGFNTVDRESTMLRGKRSNEVSVLSNARSQNDDVEPTDISVFSNAYSSF
jgi:hypothetical protein